MYFFEINIITSVNRHWVEAQLAQAGQEQPVQIGTCDEDAFC
jgi:hypothetical protein